MTKYVQNKTQDYYRVLHIRFIIMKMNLLKNVILTTIANKTR